MLPYKEYEKQVYDWLIAKNLKDQNFTFSVRRNGTEGAKLDYFIGTEKSKYFGMTFWSIKVGFPGSSGDCIDLIFKYDNDDFKYYIEFTQTNSPHDLQNTSALNLLKSLKEPISKKLGLSYESSEGNKTFTIIPKTKKEKYTSINEMLHDVEGDLEVIIPLVDEYIEKEKVKNPDFIAHRITPKEFEKMQESMDKRFKRFSHIIEEEQKDNLKKQYWLYSPGENLKKWDEFYNSGIMALGWDELGDLNDYKDKDQILKRLQKIHNTDDSKKNDSKANYQFKEVMKPGDIVFAKKNTIELIGYGKVISDYYFDSDQNEYKSRRNINWIKKGQWSSPNIIMPAKTLTNISTNKKMIDQIEALLDQKSGLSSTKINQPLNQILYGPPGTGKTYNTILKAAEIIENRKIDNFSEAKKIFNNHIGDRIEFITFHQNYSYEDFIQGLRPDVDNDTSLTFDRKDGIFKMISDRALENLNLSEKAPEEVSKDALFDDALDAFIEKVQDSEDDYHINDSVAYITEVLDNSFRYKGPNWGHSSLMKFKDLKEFYRNDVKNRQDIKKLSTISGLANQHASYFLRVYNEIIKLLPKKETEIATSKVERKNYVIIIDEINRANISRVFGELITLIEPDKRSHGDIPLKATLPSGEEFMVPSNLYIIGTMNTADKSIALLDIALRRRFEFVAMYPKYAIAGHEIYDVDILEKLNKKIIEKKGYDFQIGHSYFMDKNDNLIKRMNNKVLPLLLEYFMNDEKEVKEILNHAGLEIEPDSWPLKITGKRD